MTRQLFSYEIKDVIDLTAVEFERCQELSFGDEGYLYCDLQYAKDDGPKYRNAKSILAKKANYIVGHALLSPEWRSKYYSTQLYVDPVYRRRGIGTQLLNLSTKFSKPYIYKDICNAKFFEYFEHKTKITLREITS